MFFRKISLALKKNKLLYYSANIGRQIIPKFFFKNRLEQRLKRLQDYRTAEINSRVDYYNRLEKPVLLNEQAAALSDMQIFQSPKAYNFDTYEFTRYFPGNLKANFLFGDVALVPPVPSLLKSRPIAGDNANAVLLKLDKKRHFLFLQDKKKFQDKKNMLIGRAAIVQQHRIRFMEMYFGHPLCDLGQVNKEGGNIAWLKPKMHILSHLDYKFILSLEGNDVATNLKWIMSSNSIAVMPEPKYETWFMEGTLRPDFHYIKIKDDYSDLEERLQYFIAHETEALQIVKNANAYVNVFKDKRKESLISLLVLQKYFYVTGQAENYQLK